jgi:hypothetical protein
MSEPLKEQWEQVVDKFTTRFSPGDTMDLDGILFAIGLQELQMPHQTLKKDHKVDVFHIGICRLLEPYGYYKFVGRDEEGWPHFEALEPLPNLPGGHQTRLMKEAVVHYCEAQGWI